MKKKIVEYKKRRDTLLSLVRAQYPGKQGSIILFAPCEDSTRPFVQDSNFYYLSGMVEPASVIMITDHEQIFYCPAYNGTRDQWIISDQACTQDYVQSVGFDRLANTGKEFFGIHVYPYADLAVYEHIIQQIKIMLAAGQTIFTVYPNNSYESYMTRMVIDRLSTVIPHLPKAIVDISPLVAQLRRIKDMAEIETLYKAVDISIQAHYAGASLLQAGAKESEIQAAIEYVFTEQGAIPAYPSIVASGLQATILHYHANNQKVQAGELLVVDSGARYNYYCADLTRTYPASGTFTVQQKELYEIVLEAQTIVADAAKPGMWLLNNDEQEASLHHIAVNFFKKQGYDKYFTHSIGHFLGLDVHDVGDRTQPLQHGDVITIEPGLYIPEKKIGIRIEDNYWIVDQTTPVCLSEALPKSVKAVEEMVQQSFEVDLP